MIELQTGLPGACKSLYTIDRLEEARLRDIAAKNPERPIFYVRREQGDEKSPGIVELTLPWTEIKVEDWPKCPPNSIVVIDECQKVPGFRPRPSSVAPLEWCEPAMETHRGAGIDLVLICQHPSQLAVGIRRLVGRHMHAVRKFGMPMSTIHEWGEVKDNCDKSRSDSSKTIYKFNKKAYKYYKSAEAHTHKIRIPNKVWGLLAIIVLVPVLIWWAMGKAVGISKGPNAATEAGQVVGGPGGANNNNRPKPMTPLEYSVQYSPRIDGLPHTAPAYDQVTAPTQAPYPAACVASKQVCRCYSQQATRLEMPEQLCRQIADGGFFVAWGQPVANAVPMQAAQPGQQAQAPVVAGQLVQAGGPVQINGSVGPKPMPEAVAVADEALPPRRRAVR